MKPETVLEQIHRAGLPSLAWVSRAVGKPVNTVRNWHQHNPQLFELILLGCRVKYAAKDSPIYLSAFPVNASQQPFHDARTDEQLIDAADQKHEAQMKDADSEGGEHD